MDVVIYLAGPIHGRTDAECVAWRDEATRRWPGRVLNPMRRDYRGRELEDVEKLVREDMADIDQSDGVLVWFDKPSVGTSMEIFYASMTGLPVVVVNATENAAPIRSPWLVRHVDYITPDLTEALSRLLSLITQKKNA